jgi:chemotaxis response regulator CheB
MAKCRALKILKEALPSTSSQRIAIIQHYLSSSQTAKQSVIKQ